MTNHVHLLVTPSTPDDASKMMQTLGRYYVRYFNHTYQRTGTLWEGRFKSSVVDADDFMDFVNMMNNKIRYPKRHFLRELKQLLRSNNSVEIEMNPLLGKNRLRKSVSDYIDNQGFSFATSCFFLLHMRLLYALLVLDIHNYEVKLDEGYVLYLTKQENSKE